MAKLIPLMQLRAHFDDKCGHPLAGGSVYAFEPDTLTPKNTYSDVDGTIPNTHPIQLDYRGEADIYLLTGRYRFMVYSNDGELIYDVNDYGDWLVTLSAENVIDGDKNQHQINEEQAVVNAATNIVINGNFNLSGNIEYPEFGSQSVGSVNGIPLKRYFRMRGYYAEKPAEFDWDVHGVRAWLDMQGAMQHNLKPDTYDVASKAVGVVNYFVKNGGNNGTSNAGTDPASPLGAIYAAINRINTNAVANAVIWIAPEIYTDGNVWGAQNPVKSNVSIKIWNKSVTAPFLDTTEAKATITTETSGLTWTSSPPAAYVTARSAVGAVVDDNLINKHGDPTLYNKVSDLATCQAQAGSWFQDNTTLYAHTFNGRMPDSAVHIYVTKMNAEADTGNYTLFCERINFYGGDRAFYGHSATLSGSELIFFNKCSFKYATNNNLELRGSKFCICLDTVSTYAGADAFNYHSSIEAPTKVTYNLEVNCLSYQSGKSWSNLIGSNNGSTVHDGCYVVRFNTVTYENEGPNFADVGGGKSWLFNCIARDSLNPNLAGTHADYYTQNNHMWLDHCDASGSKYALSADANGRIYLRNCNTYGRIFQGNKLINWNTGVINS